MKYPMFASVVAILAAVGCGKGETTAATTTGGTDLLGDCTGLTAAKERIVSVSGGSATTCAAWSDGTAWCWGRNAAGELGYAATPVSVSLPGAVNVPACVLGVVAGDEHGCAWMRDGAARCWGENIFGSLGNPDGGGPNAVAVIGLATAVDLDARGYVSGALLVDGAVRAWGLNVSAGEHAQVPLEVNVPKANAIAVGNGHACALASGDVWCWGRNWAGELGIAVEGLPLKQYSPSAVRGISSAVGVAVGYEFSCAMLLDGNVWCWGRNDFGQLGNDSQVDSAAPVQVIGVESAVAVFATDDRACALLSDGSLWCWGDFVDDPLQLTAAPIPSVHNVTNVALGTSHTCVVEGESAMLCWGINAYGQLGLGEAASVFVADPTPVLWPWMGE